MPFTPLRPGFVPRWVAGLWKYFDISSSGKRESSLQEGRAEQPGLVSPGMAGGWKLEGVQQCVGWVGMPERRKSDLLCRTACVGIRKMGISSQ